MNSIQSFLEIFAIDTSGDFLFGYYSKYYSIYIANYITVDSCNLTPTSIIIPNVFSPNGDGQNDLFSISGTGIISVKAEIYNRWGSLMFSSQQLNEGWDGRTSAGTECSGERMRLVQSLRTLKW